MLEKRDLQLVRLAVRRRLLTAEQGEALLELKRRANVRHPIEVLARRRGELTDEDAWAELVAEVDVAARGRVAMPAAPSVVASARGPVASQRPRPAAPARVERAGRGERADDGSNPPPPTRPLAREGPHESTRLAPAAPRPGAPTPLDDEPPRPTLPTRRAPVRDEQTVLAAVPPQPLGPPSSTAGRAAPRGLVVDDAPTGLFEAAAPPEGATVEWDEAPPQSAARSARLDRRAPSIVDPREATSPEDLDPSSSPPDATLAPRAPLLALESPSTMLLDVRVLQDARSRAAALSFAPPPSGAPDLARPTEPGGPQVGDVIDGLRVRAPLIGASFVVEADDGVRLELVTSDGPPSADPTGLAHQLADAIARLEGVEHEGLTPIRRAGVWRGHGWLAHAPLVGSTLADRVELEGPLEQRAALELAAHVARVVARLHGAGVTHGRVEPSTIVLTPAGEVVLGAVDLLSLGGQRRIALDDAVRARRDVVAIADALAWAWTGRGLDEGPDRWTALAARGVPLLIVDRLARRADGATIDAAALGQDLAAAEALLFPPTWRSRLLGTVVGLATTSVVLAVAGLLSTSWVAAALRRAGHAAWGQSALARTIGLGGVATLALTVGLLGVIGLVRRGQIPLPGSTRLLVGLGDVLGLAGATGVVLAALLGPPAGLAIATALLGASVGLSGAFGVLLRRFVTRERRARGGGRGLAVFGDLRLRRWRWVHLPLVAATLAVALVRVAAAGYFAVEPPSAIVPQRSVP
jgi:hypothetical protein